MTFPPSSRKARVALADKVTYLFRLSSIGSHLVRILHYVDSLAPELGGITSAVRNLAACQSEVGAQVTIAVRQATADAGGGPRAPAEGELVPLGGRRRPGAALDRRGLRQLRGLVATSDVVHVHTLWSLATAQLSSLCLAIGTPFCLSLHGALGDWPLRHKHLKKAAFLATTGRRTLSRAAMIHATCEAEARMARRHLRETIGEVRVLPLPLDAQTYAFAAADGYKRRSAWAPTVVFLGRLHAVKRLDRVIAATARVARQMDAVTLVIAGSGSADEVARVRRQIEQAGIADRVTMTQFVSGETKLRLLASAAVLVLASEHENYGLVCFEALAAGTPAVVVPTVLTAPNLLASGGAVISEPDPTSLSRALGSLLDRSRSERKGAAGQQWLRTNLDPAHLGARYVQLYQSGPGATGELPLTGGPSTSTADPTEVGRSARRLA